MVKSDPAVPLLGVAIGLRVFLTLVLLVPLAVVFTLIPNISPFIPFLLLYPLIIFGLLIYQIVALVNLTTQERRRKDAASTSVQQRMALAGQPMPPLPPLPMPFTLRLRPNWWLLSLIYGPFLVVIVAASVGFGIINTRLSTSPVTNTLGAFAYPLIIVVAYLVLFAFALRQRIEVNQFGITLQRGFQKTSLYWETAALFAQVRAAPTRREVKRMALYELSNAQVLMRFAVPRTQWSPMLPQGMTLADYDRQMALLMQYISVRTGLPLIDVR